MILFIGLLFNLLVLRRADCVWRWRRVYKGHTIGEVHIAALAVDDEDVEDEAEGQVERFEGTMVIPFKNENLYAEVDKGDGKGPKVRFTLHLLFTLPHHLSALPGHLSPPRPLTSEVM